MTELPERASRRTAKLASLPLGAAGRAVTGVGRRLSGTSADDVSSANRERAAQQLFEVLGSLKGGAMKLGQAMSVFEAALPDDLAEPYREALVKLQEEAPPMPSATVHKVLSDQLGARWRERFESFDEDPAAAASIGQVHRGVWHDGRAVAIKVQYPGAGPALMADLNQLSRFARVYGMLTPGIEIKPLIAEIRERVIDELDYRKEADSQRTFAIAFDDSPDYLVPKVVASAPKVIISEWIDGISLRTLIGQGTQQQRDRAGQLLGDLAFIGPALAGLMHADPHPGNYRLMPDDRLGVFDFGAVKSLPDGLPPFIGEVVRMVVDGRADDALDALRRNGFVKGSIEVDADGIVDYLLPILEPITQPEFQFTREWLKKEAARLTNPRSPAAKFGRQLNLPPEYLMIHRVLMGNIGVLCQLESRAAFRQSAEEWLPGFAQ
ncbi:AarF/ABC1/UbiB kinase family protein [Epidermidibacterium keratini]|uniref:AarF/ABC1/UbiB kinase family protein n=1 Tax=Epidermidibacterium keratini TaxID=1891644 RepID=A0A7L4YRD3_9ACTN|nr:AarF/ABC1/UbiB kinase family protein [Epidermidibacterium keratini]QHC01608.1 AarF/ABC1/UbiB kinase family protein [Epidermidibacterium keratini]